MDKNGIVVASAIANSIAFELSLAAGDTVTITLSKYEKLLEDQKSVMIGYVDKEIVNISFAKTTKHHKTINKKMLKIIEILNV